MKGYHDLVVEGRSEINQIENDGPVAASAQRIYLSDPPTGINLSDPPTAVSDFPGA
jgi:hypothetical protein